MKYSEIIKLNKALEGQVYGPEYNISIISNIMVHQSKDICEWLLRTESINAKVTLGEYDNIVQDCQRLHSADSVILFWEACNFIDGLQYKINLYSEKDFNEIVDKVKLEIDIVLAALKQTPLVIINRFSSLIFDQFSLSKSNLKILVDILNSYLDSHAEKGFNLFYIDGVTSRLSIKSATDLRYFYSSKTLYSIDFYREYFNQIKPIFFASIGNIKKALIFDCDNTLWSGTLGEDGFNSIKVFQEIQYLAVQLAKSGVIIGLCSKNNPEDVENVLENHPDMILKNDDIIIKTVNWDNKVENLKFIAKELNIGLDSLVFIDDSSFEIGLVNQELPAVTTFQVPSKQYEYRLLMKKIVNLFYNPYKTEEDGLKIQIYKDQAKRSKAKDNSVNLQTYLMSLGMSVTVYIDHLKQISRISQLTQKTNQFNLTTRRYSEADIKKFILDNSKIVITIELNDKYGPSGLTGLAILCQKSSEIDTLLLSCRILGRNIEYKFMDIIIDIARIKGINFLNANYINTIKNSQVKDFYDKCNFEVGVKTIDSSSYSLDLNNFKYTNIKYIEVKHGK